MQLASITPPHESWVHVWNGQSYHMILPQWLRRHRTYRDYYFYPDKEDYVILDNGEAEGVRYDWYELIQMAERFNVDEVVLPDVMGDMERTQKLHKEAWNSREQGPLCYMGVCQGDSLDELHEMMKWLNSSGWVNTIGIPRYTLRHGRHIRGALAAMTKKPVHLLGMSWLFADELLQWFPENVRGIDTSIHIQAAINDEVWGNAITSPRSMFFEELVMPDNIDSQEVIIGNVGKLTAQASGSKV